MGLLVERGRVDEIHSDEHRAAGPVIIGMIILLGWCVLLWSVHKVASSPGSTEGETVGSLSLRRLSALSRTRGHAHQYARASGRDERMAILRASASDGPDAGRDPERAVET